jgi:hypothetical protein
MPKSEMDRRKREHAELAKSVDFVSDIKKTWQIHRPEFILQYTPQGSRDNASTRIGRDDSGHLVLEVRGHPTNRQVIVFHEGAHVYLFHIGYPQYILPVKAEFAEHDDPGAVSMPDEFYAEQLELEKRRIDRSECVTYLKEQLQTALFNQENLLDLEGNAISASIAVELLYRYDPKSVGTTDQLVKDTWPVFQEKFHAATDIIHHTPLPIPPNRFTESDKSKLMLLAKQACETIYGGRYIAKMI